MLKKLLVCIFFIVGSAPNLTFSAEFKGVYHLIVVDKINLENNYNQSIIFNRCGALFAALSTYIGDIDNNTQKTLANISEDNGVLMLSEALRAMGREKKKSPEDDEVTNQVYNTFQKLLKIYYSKYEENQVLTGDVFDNYMKKEFQICMQFTK